MGPNRQGQRGYTGTCSSEGSAIETHEEASFRSQLTDRRDRLQETLTSVGQRADLQRLLREVDSALGRIDAGTFGLCETCHEAIEEERLQADPLIRHCLDHLDSSERRMLEKDLELAHQVQLNLLPRPHMMPNGWKSAYHYEPAGPVSGDFCDLIPVSSDGGGLYFFLGDVSGKGVAASLLAASLHTMFRSLVPSVPSLQGLLHQANRLFCEGTLSSHYATLVAGRALADGWVEISNAGHCRPLILREGGVERIDSHGLPLGLFCSAAYDSQRIQLQDGDSVLLFSDGLIEAADRNGDQYGDDRLAGMLSGFSLGEPQVLLDAALEDFRRFTAGTARSDDLTLLVLQRNAELEA